MDDDYYVVLGVDRRASAAEIKQAYRTLARRYHPDRNPGDAQAEVTFRRINEAYDVLGDPQRRASYDAAILRARVTGLDAGAAGRTARDLLSDVFGDLFGARKRARRRGRDVRYTLTVTFAEAILGATRTIEFEAPAPCATCRGSGVRPGGQAPHECPRCEGKGEVRSGGVMPRRTRCSVCDGTGMVHADPCSDCRGTGRVRKARTFTVRVPPGTAPGAERVVRGQGEPGRFGGAAGDLRVTVRVEPHPWLRREGDDLVAPLYVSPPEAALGARVPAPSVDGDIQVRVPTGVQSGTRLRLRGKGVPRGKGGRGDLLLEVQVETPVVSAQGVGEDLLTQTLGTLADLIDADPARCPERARQRADAGGCGAGEGGGPGRDDAAVS